MFSIAHNECINYLNKNRNKIYCDDFDISIAYTENEIEKRILNKEAKEIVIHFIQSSQEPIRSLLILRLIDEKSFIEIGNIIKRSDTWCRVSFFRTKKKLIDILEKYREGEL